MGLLDFCDTEWKVYALLFTTLCIISFLSNLVLLKKYRQFKTKKTKKYNVTYEVMIRMAVMSAIAGTTLTYALRKMGVMTDNDRKMSPVKSESYGGQSRLSSREGRRSHRRRSTDSRRSRCRRRSTDSRRSRRSQHSSNDLFNGSF